MRDRTYFVGRCNSYEGKFFFFGEYENVEGEPDFFNGETGCRMLSTAPVPFTPSLGCLEAYLRIVEQGEAVINWNDAADSAFRDNLQDSIYFERDGIKPLTAKQVKALEERISGLDIICFKN